MIGKLNKMTINISQPGKERHSIKKLRKLRKKHMISIYNNSQLNKNRKDTMEVKHLLARYKHYIKSLIHVVKIPRSQAIAPKLNMILTCKRRLK